MFHLSSLLVSPVFLRLEWKNKYLIKHSVVKIDFSQKKKCRKEIFLLYLWSLRTIVKCGNKPRNGV